VPGVAAAAGESGFPGGMVRPGDVDLVAVTAKPGVSPGVLAGRIRAALHGGRGYTIATGPARGDVADLTAAVERSDGQVLGAALIPPIVMISLFVLAATTAWRSPWLLLVACGVSVIVAVLSGQIAARRAGRTSPAQALRETVAERTWPSPVRILIGLGAAGGAGTLMAFTFGQKSAAGQLALAFPLLLTCMVAVALLGPLLVAFTAWLARPARAVGGPSARLALAAISAQPRRTASAVIPVALAVAMVGAVYFADASIAHATAAQAGSTVTADRVISGSGPGAGLDAGALRQVRALPGVRAAAGVAPVSVAATDPDLEPVYGEAVSGGPLGRVLDLGVTSGSLGALRPGQIAVSALEAGPGAMGVHVGSRLTVYLPDGTPYRATVSALYARSLASGDVLIPASAVAGHTGAAPGFAQILVGGGTAGGLAGLAAAHPGWHVASRSVAKAAAAQAAQDGFANNLILGLVATLAAVALVNTLVVATVERRRALRLLGRVGASRGQVAAAFGWHALFVTVTGVVAGAAAGAVTLVAVTKAATGSWVPFIPLVPAAGLVLGVGALVAGAVMIPFYAMSRREPTLAAG
jgi:putative ABC transport system permease protein